MSSCGPTRITGRLIRDRTVGEPDLLDNSISTRTIIDLNVTRPKLSFEVQQVLLTDPLLVHRIFVTTTVPANTDIDLPLTFEYTSQEFFANRMQIQLNGLYMWSGESPPTAAPLDPIDVYPGSTGKKIRFAYALDPTDKIIILRL